MNTQPVCKDAYIHIPIALSEKCGRYYLTSERVLIAAVILLASIVLSICVAVVAPSGHKVFTIFVIMTVASFVIRFVVIKEQYFRKKRKALQKLGNQSDYTVFWNIFDIPKSYPYILSFSSGVYGLCVRFNKAEVIGKPENDSEHHYTALADAYNLMDRLGVQATHIDYMDSVGTDSRISEMYKDIDACSNTDLKKLVGHIYGNVQEIMKQSFASYDIYMFTANESINRFSSDMLDIIHAFTLANYSSATVLGKSDINYLVSHLYNIKDFSASVACEQVFNQASATQYLRVLSTSKDGVVTEYNKPTCILDEEQQVKKNARMARKGIKHRGKNSKQLDSEFVNPFDDDSSNWSESDVSDEDLSESTISNTETYAKSSDSGDSTVFSSSDF